MYLDPDRPKSGFELWVERHPFQFYCAFLALPLVDGAVSAAVARWLGLRVGVLSAVTVVGCVAGLALSIWMARRRQRRPSRQALDTYPGESA